MADLPSLLARCPIRRIISEQHSGIVFLLWGGFAQKKGKLVDKKKHRVLEVTPFLVLNSTGTSP
jgi:uracil DNA glycosylase